MSLATDWRAAREPAEVAHLDNAACARTSRSVLEAVVEHLRAENAHGGYVAVDAVAPVLDGLHTDLAGLLDPALTGADVTLLGSATEAFTTLIGAWPLARGARVGILRTDYGSNTMALAAHAERAGWTLVDLPVDAAGRIGAVDPTLDLVTFPQVASQSGIVQPAADVIASGVPVLLDVAQALGQVPVPPGAAAYVGTSRKWLCGPRGVGILAVRPEVAGSLVPAYPSLDTHAWDADLRRAGTPAEGAARFTTTEAYIAGRIGLAVAVREYLATGPANVIEGIAAVAGYARQRLDGVAGWTVRETAPAGGIVTLAPPAGVDPFRVRAVLLAEHAVLTAAIPVTRAPRDLTGPVLRVSGHVYTTTDEIDELATALEKVGRATAAAGARP